MLVVQSVSAALIVRQGHVTGKNKEGEDGSASEVLDDSTAYVDVRGHGSPVFTHA